MDLYSSAIDIAYRSEDDYLIAYVSYVYGSSMVFFGGYNIQTLNREKEAQLLQRNIIIVSIVALSIIAFLVINRKRIETKHKINMMEQEVLSANEQLKMFTSNLVEKTNLIGRFSTKPQNPDRNGLM